MGLEQNYDTILLSNYLIKMANKMDFNTSLYLTEKCSNYFENKLRPILEKKWGNYAKNKLSQLSEMEKCRLAWYFVVLEVFLDIKTNNETDILNIIDGNIIDTDFNSFFDENNQVNDLGIDLIHIDDKKSKPIIYLFNFKFRENVKDEKGQEENELYPSYHFLSSIKNRYNGSKIRGKVKDIIQKILKILAEKPADIVLCYVSNEKKSDIENSNVAFFIKENFPDIQIKPIYEEVIIKKLLEHNNPINARLFLDSDCIQYREILDTRQKKIATITIGNISVLDILKITNNDYTTRNQLTRDESNINIKDLIFENSILEDNIRNYIADSSINNEVIQTLEHNPDYFFMFNNGITIVADIVKLKKINLGQKTIMELINFQIVNGGQTIRNIFNFIQKFNPDPNSEHNLSSEQVNEKLLKHLEKCSVLVKILGLKDKSLKLNIAQYTNSQNEIKPHQLQALYDVEKLVEKTLQKENIYYIRKEGEINVDNKNNQIRRYELAQILLSVSGNPFEAIDNTESLLNSEKYDSIFKNIEEECNRYPEYVRCYFYIREQQYKFIFELFNFKADSFDTNPSNIKLLRGLTLHVVSCFYQKSEISFDENNQTCIDKINSILKDFNHLISQSIEIIGKEVTKLNDILVKKGEFERLGRKIKEKNQLNIPTISPKREKNMELFNNVRKRGRGY